MIRLNDSDNKPLMVRLTPLQRQKLAADAAKASVHDAAYWDPHGEKVGILSGVPVLDEPDWEGRTHEVTVFRNGTIFVKCGKNVRMFNSVDGDCTNYLDPYKGMICMLMDAFEEERLTLKGLEPGRWEISYACWWDGRGEANGENLIVKWIGSAPLGSGESTKQEYGTGWLRPVC